MFWAIPQKQRAGSKYPVIKFINHTHTMKKTLGSSEATSHRREGVRGLARGGSCRGLGVYLLVFSQTRSWQGWHGQGVGEERMIPARPSRGWGAQKSLLHKNLCTKIPKKLQGQGVGTGKSVLITGGDGWALKSPCREWDSLFCPPPGFGFFLLLTPCSSLSAQPWLIQHTELLSVYLIRESLSPPGIPPSSERLLQTCFLGPQSNLHPHVLKHSENSTAK